VQVPVYVLEALPGPMRLPNRCSTSIPDPPACILAGRLAFCLFCFLHFPSSFFYITNLHHPLSLLPSFRCLLSSSGSRIPPIDPFGSHLRSCRLPGLLVSVTQLHSRSFSVSRLVYLQFHQSHFFLDVLDTSETNLSAFPSFNC
jgi:hypothetical protein